MVKGRLNAVLILLKTQASAWSWEEDRGFFFHRARRSLYISSLLRGLGNMISTNSSGDELTKHTLQTI